ncbi:hypothetical protein, conserved [Plasmodium gonderi]|uniref:SANT domain-containing protein n=1 Tax=Plasmodium gonderi TaxID=77519 RepID=A0A1Y1JQ57_PLAGO|nr:hypothetical protein, conserved [Plasmodium gonderi]GAW83628.1 hypothetical protein, conserved [Plasmodium gonderi]
MNEETGSHQVAIEGERKYENGGGNGDEVVKLNCISKTDVLMGSENMDVNDEANNGISTVQDEERTGTNTSIADNNKNTENFNIVEGSYHFSENTIGLVATSIEENEVHTNATYYEQSEAIQHNDPANEARNIQGEDSMNPNNSTKNLQYSSHCTSQDINKVDIETSQKDDYTNMHKSSKVLDTTTLVNDSSHYHIAKTQGIYSNTNTKVEQTDADVNTGRKSNEAEEAKVQEMNSMKNEKNKDTNDNLNVSNNNMHAKQKNEKVYMRPSNTYLRNIVKKKSTNIKNSIHNLNFENVNSMTFDPHSSPSSLSSMGRVINFLNNSSNEGNDDIIANKNLRLPSGSDLTYSNDICKQDLHYIYLLLNDELTQSAENDKEINKVKDEIITLRKNNPSQLLTLNQCYKSIHSNKKLIEVLFYILQCNNMLHNNASNMLFNHFKVHTDCLDYETVNNMHKMWKDGSGLSKGINNYYNMIHMHNTSDVTGAVKLHHFDIDQIHGIKNGSRTEQMGENYLMNQMHTTDYLNEGDVIHPVQNLEEEKKNPFHASGSTSSRSTAHHLNFKDEKNKLPNNMKGMFSRPEEECSISWNFQNKESTNILGEVGPYFSTSTKSNITHDTTSIRRNKTYLDQNLNFKEYNTPMNNSVNNNMYESLSTNEVPWGPEKANPHLTKVQHVSDAAVLNSSGMNFNIHNNIYSGNNNNIYSGNNNNIYSGNNNNIYSSNNNNIYSSNNNNIPSSNNNNIPSSNNNNIPSSNNNNIPSSNNNNIPSSNNNNIPSSNNNNIPSSNNNNIPSSNNNNIPSSNNNNTFEWLNQNIDTISAINVKNDVEEYQGSAKKNILEWSYSSEGCKGEKNQKWNSNNIYKCVSCKKMCTYVYYILKPNNIKKISYGVLDKCVWCNTCFNSSKYPNILNRSNFVKVNIPYNFSNNDWNVTEMEKLIDAICKYKNNWDKISQSIETKSAYDCIYKFISMPLSNPYFDIDNLLNINNISFKSFKQNNSLLSLLSFICNYISPYIGAYAAKKIVDFILNKQRQCASGMMHQGLWDTQDCQGVNVKAVGEMEEIKMEDIKMEEIKMEDIKMEEIKGEEIKGEEIKGEEIKGEEIKGEEIKGEEIKGEEIKEEEIKEEEIKMEETKAEDVKEEEAKVEERGSNKNVDSQSMYIYPSGEPKVEEPVKHITPQLITRECHNVESMDIEKENPNDHTIDQMETNPMCSNSRDDELEEDILKEEKTRNIPNCTDEYKNGIGNIANFPSVQTNDERANNEQANDEQANDEQTNDGKSKERAIKENDSVSSNGVYKEERNDNDACFNNPDFIPSNINHPLKTFAPSTYILDEKDMQEIHNTIINASKKRAKELAELEKHNIKKLLKELAVISIRKVKLKLKQYQYLQNYFEIQNQLMERKRARINRDEKGTQDERSVTTQMRENDETTQVGEHDKTIQREENDEMTQEGEHEEQCSKTDSNG